MEHPNSYPKRFTTARLACGLPGLFLCR